MLEQFDGWLVNDGPVALTVIESLEPATGKQAIFFPPRLLLPKGVKRNPIMSLTITVYALWIALAHKPTALNRYSSVPTCLT